MVPSVLIEAYQKDQLLAKERFNSLPIVVGRGSDCHLRIKHPSLSRNHFTINSTHSGLQITDFMSKNGLRFRNEDLTEFSLGAAGEFRAGELTFRVTLQVRDKAHGLEETYATAGDCTTIDFGTLSGELETTRTIITSRVGTSFTIQSDPEALRTEKSNIALQAVVTWQSEIFEIANFYPGEPIAIGAINSSSIYVPILEEYYPLGHFKSDNARLLVPRILNFEVYQNLQPALRQYLYQRNIIKDQGDFCRVYLERSDVLSINLNDTTQIHFRYVPVPKPFHRRQWIENRNEFKNIFIASGMLHFAIDLMMLMLAHLV